MCRRGFSLIELVVVIAVITLMASLALVGLQSARESMRRAQCADRMRQNAMAVQSFISQHKTLPPRTRYADHSEDYYSASFLFDLLPFIEQQERFEKLANRPHPTITIMIAKVSAMGKSIRSPIAVFKCPSDSESLATNILGNTGCDIYPYHLARRGDIETTGGGGPFRDFRTVGIGQITDGVSYTALLSEKLSSPQDQYFSRDRDVWFSDYWKFVEFPSDISREKAVEISRLVPASPERYYELVGVNWAFNSRPTTLYNHVVGPNDDQSSDVMFGLSVYNYNTPGIVRATSAHRGGVNLATMDGAVSFISDSVDVAVWRKLGGRADGGHSLGKNP